MEFSSWYGSFELFIDAIKDEYNFRFWQHDPVDEDGEYTFDIEVLSVIPIMHKDYVLVVKDIENNSLSLHRLSDLLTDLGCTLIPKNTEELKED